MDLAGRIAVVTGGGRGIGRAVALGLAERGADVVVSARSENEVKAVAQAIEGLGRRALGAVCDVTKPEDIERLARTTRDRLGDAHLLINSAGIATSAPIKSETLEGWNRVLAVNATGPLLCMQAFLPGMVQAGFGRVINVASITSRQGAPYIAAYTASKHALLGLTRVAAAEYAGKGVTVNAVCPGYVDTEMTHASVERVREKTGLSQADALAAILKTANQRRLITVDEVAHIVLSLCPEAAAGVNGQAIVIDGGGLLS